MYALVLHIEVPKHQLYMLPTTKQRVDLYM